MVSAERLAMRYEMPDEYHNGRVARQLRADIDAIDAAGCKMRAEEYASDARPRASPRVDAFGFAAISTYNNRPHEMIRRADRSTWPGSRLSIDVAGGSSLSDARFFDGRISWVQPGYRQSLS